MDEPWNLLQRIGLQDFVLSFPRSFQRHRNILATSSSICNGWSANISTDGSRLAELPSGPTGSAYNSALRSTTSIQHHSDRLQEPSYMRVLIATFALLCALVTAAVGTAGELVKRRTQRQKRQRARSRAQELRKRNRVSPRKSPLSQSRRGRTETGCDPSLGRTRTKKNSTWLKFRLWSRTTRSRWTASC